MATITANAVTGLWSATSSWAGGALPANGDAVVIPNGADITFDVDMAGWATGLLTLTISAGGTLRWTTGASLDLTMRLSGVLIYQGLLYVGNSASDRIPRSSRARIITSSSATYAINRSGTGSCEIWGWEGAINSTPLAAKSALGASTITLVDDLDLEAGDTIVIGARANSVSSETNRGLYTVQSYDSGTRVVTLTTPLNWIRHAGVVCARLSRNVIITATNANAGYHLHQPSVVVGCEFVIPNATRRAAVFGNGANGLVMRHSSCSGDFAANYGLAYNSVAASVVTDCTSHRNIVGYTMGNSVFTRCVGVGISYFLSITINTTAVDCYVSMATAMVYNANGVTLDACVADTVSAGLFSSSIGCYAHACVSRCQGTSPVASSGYMSHFIARNCQFLQVGAGGRLSTSPTQFIFYGCIVNTTSEVVGSTLPSSNPTNYYPESLDHNQVAGAYRAWPLGGTVASVVDVVPDGHARSYLMALSSGNYWCFLQRFLTVPPGETIRARAWLRKDRSMAILPRLQIVDSLADPLCLSAHSPLAEAEMTDSVDTWEQVAVEWTNETDQVAELYVRCAAENALGSVWAVPEWMVGYQNRWSSMSIS